MASYESSPEPLVTRTQLADLIAEAAGGLSDRDLAVLELAYRHGLEGADLAEALEVSVAQARAMSLRLRQIIERSLGALLVARRVRRGPSPCLELAGMLRGWDGVFTARIRRRVMSHIDSCATCEAQRRRLVTPAALLGATPVFIPAPDWLRTQTLRRIRLNPNEAPAIASIPSADQPVAARRGHRTLLAVVGVIAVLAVTAVAGHRRRRA